MITITKNNIPECLTQNGVILYGAGFAGRQCQKILEENNIEVEFFVDDDRTKWGRVVQGVKVCSYEELAAYCTDKKKVTVVLTSIYGVQIAKRLERIGNIELCEMYNWYTEMVMPERYGEKIYSDREMVEYKENVAELKAYLADEESCQVYENLYQYMQTGDINYIFEIATEEEQYFIKEVKEYLGNREFAIVDAGAYEGELIRAFLENDLKVKEWYCFETNKDNYLQMERNALENSFQGKQVCINKGLWNQSTKMNVQGSGTGSKVVEGNNEEDAVDMVTIDEYFRDKKIDLIKMDIEGAETNALLGGMNVIKRDRPVLAISIYHTVEDYYNIMKLLMKELTEYKYYVRHHSMVFCETVLYAIPQ